MIKIYATENSRAMRPIWTAEEMGLDYQLNMMPFPPRVFMKEYLDVNILGTVPYLIDGNIEMTESVAISQYLVEKYGPTETQSYSVELRVQQSLKTCGWLPGISGDSFVSALTHIDVMSLSISVQFLDMPLAMTLGPHILGNTTTPHSHRQKPAGKYFQI